MPNPCKIVMTAKQEAWMRRHFKHTKNDEIMARFGWSHSTLHRFARQLGLTKTPQFMHKCQAATTAAAKASHLRNGTYPPKGYRIPRSDEFCFKKGEKPVDRIGKRREKKRIAKAQATRRQSIKEDKIRINWGLPQLTKMRLIKVPKRVVSLRHNLRKRGYIVERGSMVAYYDEHTDRSTAIESRKAGDKYFTAFKFLPLPNRYAPNAI